MSPERRRLLRALRSRLSAPSVAAFARPALFGLVILAVLAPPAVAHAEPSIEQIERQIKTESARLEKVVEQYNQTNEQIKQNQAAAGKLAATIKTLGVQLATASARLDEIAVLAYQGAPLAEASSMLAADNPATLVDRMMTLDQITGYENDQREAFASTKSRYDAEAARLSTLIGEQTAKRTSLAEQKKKINADLTKLYDLRRQAYGRAKAASTGTGAGATPPYVAGKAGVAVRYAYGALGKPYVWAADGPDGYDCSGLTLAAWRAAGVSLPHNAAMQWDALPKVSRSSLKPGDLVFYSDLGHVGIYVGNKQIIHAPTFGENVQVAGVDIMTPYGYARPG